MIWIKRLLKALGILLLLLIGLALALGIYIYNVSDAPEPVVADTSAHTLQVHKVDSTLKTIGDNWWQKNSYGIYEMYVSGEPYEMGVKNGKLSRTQIIHQEEAFTAQIIQMIPSSGYLKFLKYIVGFMNKNLPDFVLPEYQEEILGISQSASDSFRWIGDNYDRILNYHAAHDIGHALQNLMLVGCTSFGVWDSASADGSLLIGRNFDFWVGDNFSKEKMINFYRPSQGHPFMFVSWGGFTGVVSGMNTEGLTITINAARSAIPWGGAATPVSLVAREIIQYASNIDEAIAIARKRKMFVSESFLIGSAKDHKAIIIEKTPDTLAIYDANDNKILCTNHYQSEHFQQEALNQTQMANSASVYRHQRLKELIFDQNKMTPTDVARVLRDRKGLQSTDIGEGNEKAINQLIAHHSIIFQPDSLRVWVSTSPWQLGEYISYDLNKIFSMKGLPASTQIYDAAFTIPADSFIQNGLNDFMKFREQKMLYMRTGQTDTAVITKSNPNLYDAWRIAGDYAAQQKWNAAAKRFYTIALQKEIATVEERKSIEEKLNKLRP